MRLHKVSDSVIALFEAFDYGQELIALAEAIGKWEKDPCAVVNDRMVQPSFTGSLQWMIPRENEQWAELDKKVHATVAEALEHYHRFNEHLQLLCPPQDEPYAIEKFDVDQKFDLHSASSYQNPVTSTRHLGVLMMLNDHYHGGIVHFPRQELTLQFQGGTMVVFPAFFTHPFFVSPVTKGTKYMLATFLH